MFVTSLLMGCNTLL